MFSLKNRFAVITGGASGIGLAITKSFLEQGAEVLIFERDFELAEKEVTKLRDQGYPVTCLEIDVSQPKKVESAMPKKVNVLVNNAGIALVGNIENTNDDELDRLYSVNVKGVFHCMRAAIPIMKENKGGVIINMASVAGSVGISDRFAYSMSKGAVIAMTMQVAKDYVKENIRCNSISPARIHTPFVDGFIKKYYAGSEKETFEKLSNTQPIGRMGTPEEVAAMAVYLASDEAAFITGSDFKIDGGFTTLNN